MALRGASAVTTDSEWLDFKELAKENTAALFTVTGFGEPKDFGNGEVTPVIADVIILTGSKAGSVHKGERILAAGIRNKLTEVGSQIVGRLRPYGQRRHPGLEAEESGDIELAEAALAKFEAAVPGQRNGNGSASTKSLVAEDAGGDEPPPF